MLPILNAVVPPYRRTVRNEAVRLAPATAPREGELFMRTIKSLSRLGVVLASLAVVAVGFASGASASTAMIPEATAAEPPLRTPVRSPWSTPWSWEACRAGRSP